MASAEAIATEELSIDTSNPECDTKNGYFWYTCTWKQPYYSGCCRVDPCRQNPIGCPLSARQPYTTTAFQTLSVSSQISSPTDQATSESLLSDEATTTFFSTTTTSSTPSPGVPASPIISSSLTADSDNSSHGVTLSVNALVGIVVGCTLAALFIALMICMWLARRRREKKEKSEQAERMASSRGLDEEVIPPGLESVFNPMAQTGPGSVFDRAEGRMGKSDSFLALNSLARNSNASSIAHSSFISPLTPASTFGAGLGLPSSPSELDSTPVSGSQGPRLPQMRPPAELEYRPFRPEEAISKSRATLNSTPQERESGTYANSWTRFQNVQL